jgi:hypothetical protein
MMFQNPHRMHKYRDERGKAGASRVLKMKKRVISSCPNRKVLEKPVSGHGGYIQRRTWFEIKGRQILRPDLRRAIFS